MSPERFLYPSDFLWRDAALFIQGVFFSFFQYSHDTKSIRLKYGSLKFTELDLYSRSFKYMFSSFHEIIFLFVHGRAGVADRCPALREEIGLYLSIHFYLPLNYLR